MYGQATQAEGDEPMMATKAASIGQLRSPLSAGVAREKAAIEQVISLLQMNLDDLEMTIASHAGKINPVSTSAPMDSPADSIGFEYMGSSPVYDQLHSLLVRVAQASDVVRTLTRRLEV